MNATEKELVKEGLELLDGALQKFAEVENIAAIKAIAKLVHGAVLTAELLLKLE